LRAFEPELDINLLREQVDLLSQSLIYYFNCC